MRVALIYLAKRFASSSMSRAFTGALNAAVPTEAELTGSGGLEDPCQRPTAVTMDPETPDDAALSQRPQKAPKRCWRHDQ